MKNAQRLLLLVALLLGLGTGNPVSAAPGSFLGIFQVTGGLSDPIGVTNAGDGSGRLFIIERAGTIRIWNGSQLLPNAFLNISSLIQCAPDCGERGLLGLAFHPNYENNGRFYVFYTRAGDGTLVISRYQVSAGNSNIADDTSGNVLLTIPHPRGNHNGGHLAFGPNDSYLYISTGDGGDAGDPDENGQNINTLLGKILRLNVDADDFPADPDRDYAIPGDNPFVGTAGADEVWAYGLRNPWRFSFDRGTGDLYIGDVGQEIWEEINFEEAFHSGGVNYGWDCREGRHNYTDPNGDRNAGCAAVPSVDPVLEYSHSLGCSVTGGYVFRNLPGHDFTGDYFYGDFCSGRIWRGINNNGSWTDDPRFDTSFGISSFGESEKGRIYFTDLFGDTLQWLAPYTFADVLPTSSTWPFVEAIYAAGITSGCGGDNFCPATTLTRGQMAVFLLVAAEGSGYTPPACTTPQFSDVPCSNPLAPWINELANRGITSGCGGGNFCPNSAVTREQMAVFLLLAREGSGYTPPACTTPQFNDVPCSSPFAAWINELADRGITGGCGGGNYCPGSSVSREQMAVFLTATFGLPTP